MSCSCSLIDRVPRGKGVGHRSNDRALDRAACLGIDPARVTVGALAELCRAGERQPEGDLLDGEMVLMFDHDLHRIAAGWARTGPETLL
jgi:hypothetical protein